MPVIPARRALLLLVVLLVASLFWFVDGFFEPMWDAVLYVLTTRSLVAGDGYAVFGDPFTLRPPGFSLLLTPVMAVFGTDFLVLNIFVSLLGILAIALIFVWFRRRLGTPLSFALCVALWISPQYQGLCNVVLSDTIGLAAIFACLLLDRRARRQRSIGSEVLLGAAIGVALYFRAGAVLLIPAVVLGRLLDSRTPADGRDPRRTALRIAVLLALPFVVQAPWTLWKHHHPAPLPSVVNGIYSYSTAQWHTDPGKPDSPLLPPSRVLARVPVRFGQTFTAIGSRLPKLTIHEATNLREFKRLRAENVKPFGLWLGMSGVLCLIVVCLRRRDPGSLFALGNLGVCLIYFDYDERLLVPTYVFVLAAVLELLLGALRRVMAERRAGAVAAGLVLVMGVLDASPGNDRRFIIAENETNTAVAGYVNEHYPEDIAVGASMGHRLAGFFERPIYFLELAARQRGLAGAMAVIRAHDIRVFIHTGPVAREWTRSMERFLRERARLVHRIDDVTIYELPRRSP